MSTLRSVSKQTFWQIIGKAVTSITTLLTLSVVTRSYGASATGVFTLTLTYLAFFYMALEFGINAYLLPSLLKDNSKDIWQKLLGLRIAWAFCLFLLANTLPYFLPFQSPSFNQSVFYGSLAILFASFYISVNAIFQSKLRYDQSVIASSLGTIVATVTIIILALNKAPVPYLLLGHALGWLADSATAYILIKKILIPRPVFDLGFIKEVFIKVWPISATLVLNIVYFRADSFIIGAFRNFSEVGVYNLAYQVFQSALVLPTFIMNGYYPIMLQKLESDHSLFRLEIRKALGVMLLLAVGGTLATLLLAPAIVGLIAGEGFEGSVTSLRILSYGFPAYFVSSLLMWTLVSLKRYKSLVVIYLIGLIFNIGLNLLLIPKYSYIASSWLTGASEYLILLLQLIILRKLLFK